MAIRRTIMSTALALAACGTVHATLPTGPDTQLAYLACDTGVMLIDTVTGDRDWLSGSSAGSGTAFPGRVADVLIENSTTLIVAVYPAELFRVDRTTGARTLLSITNSGSPTVTPTKIFEMEWESAGVLLFLGQDAAMQGYVGRVDLGTMTRTVVSSSTLGVGSGSAIGTFGTDMVKEPSGTMMVADFGNGRVMRIDPATGNRTTPHTGFLLYSPTIVQLPSGLFYLTEYATTRFLHTYDAATDALVNTGYSLPGSVGPVASACYADGTVLIYNGGGSGAASLIRVNPSTGSQTTVAGPGIGTGPALPFGSYFDSNGLLLVNAGTPASVEGWNKY